MKNKANKNKRKVQPYSIGKQIPFLLSLNRKDKLSIFLGAGISSSCGLPDWNSLLKIKGAEHLKFVTQGYQPIELVGWAEQ